MSIRRSVALLTALSFLVIRTFPLLSPAFDFDHSCSLCDPNPNPTDFAETFYPAINAAPPIHTRDRIVSGGLKPIATRERCERRECERRERIISPLHRGSDF